MTSEYEENMAFERDARRVAEAVWHLPPGGCQPEFYPDAQGLKELDGIARLRDVTHLMMVTVSRKLEKLKDDVKKLNVAEKLERQRTPTIAKWLITRDQLEAQHLKYARENSVTVLTLEQFRDRFFDGRRYVHLRQPAAFGSARNLADGSVSISDDEYVSLPMTVTRDHNVDLRPDQLRPISLTDLTGRLLEGRIVVVMAPFGSGKSLTTREIFRALQKKYLAGESDRVPVAINLREHWGQEFGDEMLERHARSIGFEPREDLVVAWRAGMVVILLDGFDELASQVVARANDLRFMQEARSEASKGLRNLLNNTPTGSGVLICGRDHYFDSERELSHALGLTGRLYSTVRLGEFTEDQASEFLRRKGISLPLPDWLPRKPLILGYLAHRGLLEDIVKIDSSQGFGYAWNQFLTLISDREASAHHQTVMDPATLRRVLERLACGVRATASGTGPITGRELAEAYQAETGLVPIEGVLMQLQRLPGLTPREQDPTARSFIDEDFLAALQGSAVGRFALENVGGQNGRVWVQALGRKGIGMAAFVVKDAGANASTVITRALASIQGDHRGTYETQIGADCVLVALEMAREEGYIDCRGIKLIGVTINELDLEDLTILNLALEGCLIEEVIVGPRVAESTLVIRNCLIARVRGAASDAALPPRIFQSCEFNEFDDVSTNTAVIRSALAPPLKALLTILRKLYVQAGGGRKVAALKRGLPSGPILDSVDQVLGILESEDVIHISSQIAHPIRRQTARIHNILNSVALSQDSIISKVREIGTHH